MQSNGVHNPKDIEAKVVLVQPVAKPNDVKSLSESAESKFENDNSSKQHAFAKPDLPLRLTIERDDDSGEWVYKSVNRLTGEVVTQFPREEILNMKRSRNYKPGSVIKTDI